MTSFFGRGWQPRFPIMDAIECVERGGRAQRISWGDRKFLFYEKIGFHCVWVGGYGMGSGGPYAYTPSPEDATATDWIWREPAKADAAE